MSEQPQRECTCTQGPDYEGPCSWCDVHGQPSVAHRQGVDAGYQEAKFGYELDAAASARGIQEARAERDALKARVEQLTAALFELTAIADRVIHREGNHGVTWMGLLTNKVAESRAVLAKVAK